MMAEHKEESDCDTVSLPSTLDCSDDLDDDAYNRKMWKDCRKMQIVLCDKMGKYKEKLSDAQEEFRRAQRECHEHEEVLFNFTGNAILWHNFDALQRYKRKLLSRMSSYKSTIKDCLELIFEWRQDQLHYEKLLNGYEYIEDEHGNGHYVKKQRKS